MKSSRYKLKSARKDYPKLRQRYTGKPEIQPGDLRAEYLDWKHGSGAGQEHLPEESPLESEAKNLCPLKSATLKTRSRRGR